MNNIHLRDFKSFLEESSKKTDTWRHITGEQAGWSTGDLPAIHNPSSKTKSGAVLGYQGNEDGVGPWHTQTYNHGNSGEGEFRSHKTLKAASEYLNQKGHSIPDHHITQLKARALKSISESI